MNKKVCLIILDGFGHTEETRHNAIYLSKHPTYEKLLKEYPHSLILTHGKAVGLPDGVMGNSEVGHLSIGSGRVIYMELTKITKFAEEQGFNAHAEVKRLAKNSIGAIHLLGLVSDGGVHSHIEHLKGLIDSIYKISKEKPVFVHVITDGRDTPPNSGLQYVRELQETVDRYPNTTIASVCGRYYAMDRDKRWDRIELAYKAYIGKAETPEFTTAEEAIQDAYNKKETDEFIKPRWIQGGIHFQSNDQAIFFNYRADRARQISQAFAVADFKEFATPVKLNPKNWVTFTVYQKDFPFPALFPPETHKKILAEIISDLGKRQLRVAETEKYAHVTYFFNGGVEKPYPGEDRVLVPSPKDVKTYDLKPEMSASEVTNELLKGLDKNYDFIVVNYANGDMIGHTGIESAAIKAVETLDECLTKVVKKGLDNGFDILITADHGNCEEMYDFKNNQPHTQHSLNPVPCLWISKDSSKKKLRDGILADIAPTILDIMKIPVPKEMTGHSLIGD